MAEHLRFHFDEYERRTPYVSGPDGATHVAWALDDLAELAADIHLTVLRLLVRSDHNYDIDAAIIDRLRGTATRAADGPDAVPG